MKKIMFNDKYSLTQAVLDGRKTQTRRTCRERYWAHSDIINAENGIFHFEIPRYKEGEVVAIAQSYGDCGNMPDYELDEDGYPIMPKRSGFFNKMFVRADLMPHHIRITNIKIERLQNISDEDCFKEGIFKWDAGQKDIPFYSFHNADIPDYNDPRDAFAELIDKVSGKGTWESNPYVFVYEFELVH